MAPVVKELERRSREGLIESVVCVTGQHRQMLDQVLGFFQIRPDHDLDVMRHQQTLTSAASTILRRLEVVLTTEEPDWVLVQGDTTTAAVGALAAFYAGCRVGHVEAGLRTGLRREPFPEEINRRLADTLADWHFAPTPTAARNLKREQVPRAGILVTGNTVVDALHLVAGRSPPSGLETLVTGVRNRSLDGRRLILVTAHRRESFGRPLAEVCEAVRDLATQGTAPVRIVFPVHLNPCVYGPVHRVLGEVPDVVLTPPVNYPTLVHLMKRAHVVLTDSGGIQEEAPSLGVPVLVLRNRTERTEGIAAGTVRVVGTDRGRIVKETMRLLTDPEAYRAMVAARNPYGDGRAAKRVVAALLGEFPIPFDPERDPGPLAKLKADSLPTG